MFDINPDINILIGLTKSGKGIKIVVGDDVYLTSVDTMKKLVSGEWDHLRANLLEK